MKIKAFCTSQIFVIGDKNVRVGGVGDCIAEGRRSSVRHGDNFDWLGGHSENHKAPEVSWWALWLSCSDVVYF